MSILSKEQSVLGAATMGVAVYGIYNLALPSIADERANSSHDDNLYTAERAATWATAGLVAVISILAKDPTIFVVGGGMVIGMAWWHRHSNGTEPALGGAFVMHPAQAQAQMEAGNMTADMTAGYQG